MYNFMKMLGASFGCMCLFANVSAAPATARVQTARMPSMAVLTTNAMGNMATNVVQEQKTTPYVPDVTPDVKPDDKPDVKPECDDGGVRNSEYTVDNCMNEILSCINNGALAGGLNDLFNEDMRNAIVNGMGLCSVQVDKCMVSVRRDCKPVYRAMADVWVDFNSRKVQPEYYNFVLRKTGLTPNQAENTCMLLDKNTYGPSFAAVANSGTTTNEYNKNVGAYNGQQGNVLIKSNPMGVTVNDGNPGVDGQRGHYARWDATTATCYLRVAAYNKDEQIKNSWLFGALGDDQLAEVWRPAGDTFSCNKDLFGFSLLNDTSTAAVVGVGGGTLLGAGIGAIAGHGKRAFDCSNAKHRKMLVEALRENGSKAYLLNKYVEAGQDNINVINGGDISEAQCDAIVNLYTNYNTLKEGRKKCDGVPIYNCSLDVTANPSDIEFDVLCNMCESQAGLHEVKSCVAYLTAIYPGLEINEETSEYYLLYKKGCKFKTLQKQRTLFSSFKCDDLDVDCMGETETSAEISELDGLFGDATKKETLGYLILNGERSTMGKNIGIGAAIGAGTGGVATAITAFVEKNNISCRVGDGLNTVAFGKSHSIDTLKDFYVKWNLRLPDTVSPTSTAVDCKSWKLACAQYTDLNQCKSVALNYKPDVNGTITLVRSACSVSGSVCIENEVVAKSYGACE